MMKKIQVFSYLLSLLFLFGVASAGTYEEGAKAYVTRNYSEAKTLFLQATKEKDGRALNSLGVMYERGEGVAQDYKQALNYYQQAYKLGNVKSIGNLAAMYERGLGTKKDKQEALYLYFMGLEKNDGKSINNLGVMAGTDDILPMKFSVAWALFELAKDAKDPFAVDNQRKMESLMTKLEKAQGKVVYKHFKEDKNDNKVDIMLLHLGLKHLIK